MPVFLIEGPAYIGVECLHRGSCFFGNVPHDGGDHLAFVEALFAFYDIFW